MSPVNTLDPSRDKEPKVKDVQEVHDRSDRGVGGPEGSVWDDEGLCGCLLPRDEEEDRVEEEDRDGVFFGEEGRRRRGE